jgi:hypothetical protein
MFWAGAGDIAQGHFTNVFFPVLGVLAGISKSVTAKRCQTHRHSNQKHQRKKQFSIVHICFLCYIYFRMVW